MPVAHHTPAASLDEDAGGGSSPVLPILIAVILLAAVSIGVALYRNQPDRATPQA